MAIWQFDFFLVPTNGILKEHGEIPTILDTFIPSLEEIDTNKTFIRYWHDADEIVQFGNTIAKYLPEIASWSSDARMFGHEDGTKIEVWDEDVSCRIHASEFDIEWATFFSELSNAYGCKIVIKENGHVIDPTVAELTREFESSTAKRYIEDPVNTIIKLEMKN